MGGSIVSAKRARTSSAWVLSRAILPTVVYSAAVSAAYSLNYWHTPTFGSIGRGIGSNNWPSPSTLFWQHRRDSNRYHDTLRHRKYIHASSTACKSTISDGDATTSAYTPRTHLLISDIEHMKLAARLARNGYGNTFPNPAVGCVLVRHHDDDSSLDSVIGSGFHPKAGMPHAEVFALLEACSHVEDGAAAAKSVMGAVADTDASNAEAMLAGKVLELFTTYKSEEGASELFNSRFDDCNVTAYVTLEPCCHWGQTPPCATSLAMAGVSRVVVGYRDPNPRVDGGGICVLQNAGIGVHVIGQNPADDETTSSQETEAAAECSDLVKYFVKRISPREDPVKNLDDVINGKKRRALRSIAGRQKSTGTIQQIGWPKDGSITEEDKKSSEFAERVPIGSRLLESIDQALWDHEILLLRLNNAVHKKKGAKIIGGRIAEVLNAHVAQVIGHTALLYRPTVPPVLDLDELVKDVLGDINSD